MIGWGVTSQKPPPTVCKHMIECSSLQNRNLTIYNLQNLVQCSSIEFSGLVIESVLETALD